MKKGFFTIFFSLIFAFLLTACGGKGIDLKDLEVNGFPDAEISFDTEEISFDVASNVLEFDVSDISFAGEGITLRVYSLKGDELNKIVKLEPGLNEFKLIFSLDDLEAEWRLKIKKAEEIKVSSIEIAEFPKEYLIGDSFKGGKLSVTYSDGSKEEVNIVESMLEGFNTSFEGKKTIIITYLTKSITVDINVVDPNKPIEYDTKLLKEVATRIQITDMYLGYYDFDYEYQNKYNFIINNMSNEDTERFRSHLNEAKLSADSLASFNELLKTDVYKLLKLYNSINPDILNSERVNNEIVTQKNLDILFNVINKINTIITPEQLAHLIPESFMASRVSQTYGIFDTITREMINVTLPRIKELVNNESFNAFTSHVSRAEAVKYEDRLLLAKGVFEIMNAFKTLDKDKILLAGGLINAMEDVTAFSPNINALADILLELHKKTNGFENIHKFMRAVLINNTEYTSLEAYEHRNDTLEMLDLAFEALPEIILMMKKIDKADLEAFTNLFKILLEDPDANMDLMPANIVTITKLVDSSIVRLEENKESFPRVKNLVTAMGGNALKLEELFTHIHKLSKLDEGNLTDEDKGLAGQILEKAMAVFSGSEAQSNLMVKAKHDNFLVEKGKSLDDFINLFKDLYTITYTNPETNVGENVVLTAIDFEAVKAYITKSLEKEGIYSIKLTIKGEEYSFKYYVYDKANLRLVYDNSVFNTIDTACYVDKAGKLLYVDSVCNINTMSQQKRDLNTLFTNTSYGIYLSTINTMLSRRLSDYTYELVYENQDGVNLSLIKLTTELGDVYLPLHIIIVDTANPVITDVLANSTNNRNRIAVEGLNDSFMVVFDYGLNEVLKPASEIGLDINKLGKQKCSVILNDKSYEFELTVIEGTNASVITDIITSSALSIENIKEHERKNDIRFDVNDKYSRRMSMGFNAMLDSLWNSYKGSYTKMSYTIERLEVNDYQTKLRFTMFGDNNVIFTDIFYSSILSNEEWHQIYLDLEDGTDEFGLVLADSEYLRLSKLNEDELKAELWKLINKMKFKAYSHSFDGEVLFDNLLKYLNDNNLRYLLAVKHDPTKKTFTATLSGDTGIIFTGTFIEESINKQAFTVRGMDPLSTKLHILDKPIETNEEALEFIIKYATVRVDYPVGSEIVRGEAIRKLFEGRISNYTANYGLSWGSLTLFCDNNNISYTLNIPMALASDATIEYTGPQVYTNSATIDMDRIYSLISYGNFTFNIKVGSSILRLPFDSPDVNFSIAATTLDEATNTLKVLFNFKIDNHVLQAMVDMSYIDPLFDRLAISPKTIIYLNDVNNPTDEEILDSLLITYSGCILAGINKEYILSKVTFDKKIINDQIEFKVISKVTNMPVNTLTYNYFYRSMSDKYKLEEIILYTRPDLGFNERNGVIYYDPSYTKIKDIDWIVNNSYASIRLNYGFYCKEYYSMNDEELDFIKANLSLSYELVEANTYEMTVSYLGVSNTYKLIIE